MTKHEAEDTKAVKKAAKKPNKTSSPKPAVATKATQPKRRKVYQDRYRSFRLQKRIKHPRPEVTGSFRLFRDSLKLLRRNWKLFGGISLLYLLLSLVLVRGFGSAANLPELKGALNDYAGETSQLGIGVALAGTLITSGTTFSSNVSAAYQSMLLVVVSLALIWALRQVLQENKVRVRDAFYKGMYPLSQFFIVLLIIALQLLPIIIAGRLFGVSFSGGLAASAVEQVVAVIFVMLLIIWSLYMVTSSVFALYIVTLPDMAPMQALRSARGLVQFRRWMVMRKILFLPAALVVLGVLIMFPIVLVLTPAAEFVFYMITLFSLALVHAYMYNLYRELIK